jgi:ABC-type Mn2+/Zn2+ transport system ATPase subunit
MPRPLTCAGELSEGELQRLAFARVLHRAPRLAVMDEPVAAVSAEQGQHLLGLLKEAGIGVLLTGQLGCVCMTYVDHVIVLSGDAEGRGWSVM